MKLNFKKGLRQIMVWFVVGFMVLGSLRLSNNILIVQAEEKPTATTTDFSVVFTDESDQPVNSVDVPHPINMKVVDKGGNAVSEDNYDITWIRETKKNEQELGRGNTLAFLSTTPSMAEDGFPVKAILKDKKNIEPDVEVSVTGGYAVYNGETVLIVNDKPVYPGSTEPGASLSLDGNTVTFENINIKNEIPFIWTRSVVYLFTHNKDITLNIIGENNITSLDNDGVSLEVLGEGIDNEQINVNIAGGGTLNVDLKSDNGRANKPFGIYGFVKKAPKIYTKIEGSTVFNLKTNADDSNRYSGNAFVINPSKEFRLNDGTINTDSDGFISLDINGRSFSDSMFYVGKKGNINIQNTCTVQPPDDPQKDGSSNVSGIYYDGFNTEIDGGQIDIQMQRQNASTYAAYLALEANTTIKNKSVVKASLAHKEGEGEHLEQVNGLVSRNMTIDDSTVDVSIDSIADKITASWGIAFARNLNIQNNSNVNINMNNGVYKGINYGGPNNNLINDYGKINIKESSVTINGTSSYSDELPFWSTGIDALKLNVELDGSNDAHKVDIHTASNNNISTPIFLNTNILTKQEYSPFYVPKLLTLGGVAGISTPEGGSLNVLSYLEDEDSSDYVNGEVVYGTDKTMPAKDLIISKNSFVFQELIDPTYKLSLTGLIDRNAKLHVTSDVHKDCSVCEKMKTLMNPMFLGDISLIDVENPYQGELGITFEVDAKYNDTKVTLLHCVDGKEKQAEATVVDGKVGFMVSSLSPFALYDVNENPVMKYHTLHVTNGDNGTVSETGDIAVLDGESRTFTFTPNSGYQVKNVFVDGLEVKTTGNSYTFDKVTADHTLHVEFVKKEVQTGIQSQTNLYIGLFVLSGGIFATSLFLKKRKASK